MHYKLLSVGIYLNIWEVWKLNIFPGLRKSWHERFSALSNMPGPQSEGWEIQSILKNTKEFFLKN